MRRFLQWSGAAVVILLAGVLVDSARATPSAGLRHPVRRAEAAAPDRRLGSAVLLQRTDCSGNLRLLDLLARSDVAERVQLRVIWFVGPATDSVEIRSLLPRWTRSVPLKGVPTRVVSELALLGHRSTPVIVMYDQEGRVRLTSQSPRSLREFAGLRRAIEGLTWIEEL
jgi:hypothetical protein